MGDTVFPARASTQAALAPSGAPVLGPVLLPSYNGSRKLPNLTPLLAWALPMQVVKPTSNTPSATSVSQASIEPLLFRTYVFL